ncbi:YraN family protein [Planctomycetota bacterium]
MADRSLLGRWGEKYCRRHLQRKGFKTLTQNFSCKTGEIDLIMVDRDGTIVFIEIKTRADETFADIESSITTSKQIKLQRAARFFLASNNIENRPCRFDIVTIVLAKSGKPLLKHYENAFVP